jgi:putative transcriptional regulator
MIKQAGLHQIHAGDLLVSPPQVQMASFSETVILMGTVEADGAQGWVMNRPTGHGVSEILKDMDVELGTDFELYWGGPVSPHTVWLLHEPSWRMSNTRDINDQWAVTSNELMFHALAEGDAPRYFKIMLGYSGWDKNQLNEELEGKPPRRHNHSWLVLRDPDTDWLAERADSELWREAVALSVQQTVNQLF